MGYFHLLKYTYNSDMNDLSELKRLIGRNIRSLRKRRSWSQDALSENAELSCKFVGEIERGAVNPSLDSLMKIADALGVEVAELFLTENVYMITGINVTRVRSSVNVIDNVLGKLQQS